MDWAGELAAVGLVFGLLAAALWLLRRRGLAGVAPLLRSGGSRRRMECVERLPLGAQQGLHLIRLGRRGLLVSSSPRGCALLAEIDWRETLRDGEAEL